MNADRRVPASNGASDASEIERLRARVAELEETLGAIRSGEIDAVIVEDASGCERLYTLSGPDTPYQVFVDRMHEGALTVGPDEVILYSNERFAELSGAPLESVIGRRLGEFVADHDRPELTSMLHERSSVRELELLRRDARRIPVRWSASVLADSEQAPRCFVVTEIGVQRHIGQLQALIGAMIDAMSQADIPSALRVLTERACAIVQTRRGTTVVPEDADWTRHVAATWSARSAAAGETLDPEVRRKVCAWNRVVRSGHDGTAPAVSADDDWLAAPLTAADGSNLGLVHLSDKLSGGFTEQDEVLIRHIAQIAGSVVRTKRAEAALFDIMEERNQLLEAERAARSEAERASRMKDEFVATLSHELRTPLNAILGWSYMISRGDVQGDDLRQGLETIERNARIQVQMIEDLLDMSRITAGKIRLELQEVEFDAIVDSAIESIRPAAESKRIRVYRKLRGRADRVAGDPHRLQQVVWNLLSNAVKFTGKGGSVTVAMGGDATHSELCVTDDGIGIAGEFLPHVFDRFRQADGSTTRSYSGLGLGLAIVKQLVELHGGTIRATSAGPGLGATFVVRLPLASAGQRANGERSPDAPSKPNGNGADGATLAGLTVLYVDDESDARDMIARILSEHGAHVLTGRSAAEARDLVAAARPDVLLSDIGMPIEDGYSLIRSIRSLPEERGGRVAAAAVTALARTEDRDRALQAGFQTHIAKPVEASQLVAVVARLAGREVGASDLSRCGSRRTPRS